MKHPRGESLLMKLGYCSTPGTTSSDRSDNCSDDCSDDCSDEYNVRGRRHGERSASAKPLYDETDRTMVSKYLKGMKKNKEKNQFYHFKKYLAENNVFFVFVHLFVKLIRNRDTVENPYDYVMKYYGQRGHTSVDDALRRNLIKENKKYRTENEQLVGKINELLVQVEDLRKKDTCNFIANWFFKNGDEQLDWTDLFGKEFMGSGHNVEDTPSNYTTQNNQNGPFPDKDYREPTHFVFSRDTFYLFLSFLDDPTRMQLREVLTGGLNHEGKSVLCEGIHKGLSVFVNQYVSLEKLGENGAHKLDRKKHRNERIVPTLRYQNANNAHSR
ncbi:conserved Plasmodium protein, unknown function [Plasmodium knowlesi strain H]|uniref:Uncharacterized protein n=3 Tax=Plasmodium knowlesi TaxID=5850 RepID=A0A5K1VEL2_PLAKH|nr:conserved Plasmodium protein, unknown function [Plasmodium knowlesi strain H]OTN64660.1 Uncharacterized protein PKNOH_S130196100 [Plasmodium knowlesi]CAA9989121.1 conserved Plasmodium protein, unknown function [Plasmodium knowlesi strain H]SBO27337.1 conserved Plasmodium protein, unknown function [Plasmodium knowlesi strain H]SBO28960.1 conserved Plasmodium protein, unknown function [Plasmodium knowlesi strain H]VVS78595.1 conserved Plasmodium protein, unknown function [Plasmodium knowlesi |eukprot:XP_002261468.1 hypothetical protein, conserved in Plasmodium species [Plasmodium knowlesi strain H]